VSLFHLDTDVLVWGCSHTGAERERLFAILEAGDELAMSAWAWYEFCRGPRTPEQLAAATVLLGEAGVVPISRDIAEEGAEVFRSLGSPRGRAADLLIGVTARVAGATLLTRNARDFAGITGLELEVVG
jgi:predicted nucleic acid-binding protein